MSKRNSFGPSNTLLKYFTKTPPANKKAKLQNEVNVSSGVEPDKNHNEADSKSDIKKRERQQTPSPELHHSDSEDELPLTAKRRKRIRLNPVDSDDSDTENKADNKATDVKEKSSVGQKLHDSFSYETKNSPQPKSTTNVRPVSTPAKFQPIEKDETPPIEEGNWVHCKLEFLKPGKIKDAQKRSPDHPDYDPSTLYVPPEFFKQQTAAHKQWWEMKSSHFDCVLFFKVGKFYELYHMDAAVGVNELGFSYMKGEFAHSGFPESAYARMASTLVAKGYKVARVEQTETPDMMQERCKRTGKTSKWEKVVRREVCQVTLRGTQVCGLQDPGPSEHSAAYMLALTEEENQGCSSYGVCFIDTSIGLFHIGQFKDDKHSSRLLTTMAHFPPALIVYERKSTTARTVQLLSTHWHASRREARALSPPETTLRTLAEKYYKTNEDGDWPEGLKPFLHQGDALGLTPAANCSLAVKALGGCVDYLSHCLLDIQILAMAQFSSYEPPDVAQRSLSQEERANRWEGSSNMVLDAITLRNLRIVQDEGCLYDKLNFCSTPMGKRLLYQWVCAPSCNLALVKQRQQAVRTLFEDRALSQEARSILASLPDLERLLAKVHSLGNLSKSKSHPDSRAIFYEEKAYSKRKVLDFISVLNGFTEALKLAKLFSGTDSAMLKNITQLAPEGKYPDYRDTLKFFKEGFNQSEAEKEGRILPGAGVDPEYDNAISAIKEIDEELQDYRKEQEKFFRCRVAYVGTDRKRYQLEVAESAAARAGSGYQLEGARKGFKRFSTADTRELLNRMISAEEQKTVALKDLSRRMFERFSSHQRQWEAAANLLAALDVLLAMAEFASQQTTDVCLPTLTDDGEQPFIKIVEGRHPCIPVVNEFIPNDTALGEGGTLLLLTGPNMGGKSTLMRQVGLLTVLAHLGSYVPAQECSLSLVDRVFTRLGASDDILSGQSTFLVEMNETAAIVRHATRHSLVLLDELGRGTSTYDGTAIASGVCAELAARGCRVVFSTHYHSLVHHLQTHPGVVLGHMACMVETDESTADSDEHIPEETITFLYKLSPGACPKSYGFNAARLAGVPSDVTRRAHLVSRKLEREAVCVRTFRRIAHERSPTAIRELLAALTV